ATPCNKREPGSGCPAQDGVNRIHGVLGTSDSCIAVHPSDMCVGLAALDARVNVLGINGQRTIPFTDFHRLPGDRPDIDTNLAPDEIIVSVDVPDEGFGQNHTYLKLRDRLSYAFALISVAAAMRIEKGVIADARLALGGVAHKPWRDVEAEALLIGREPDLSVFGAVADKVMSEARGFGGNDFKIDLARRAIRRALSQAAAGTPQSQSYKRVH
ncbi:MAG: xanthine dehydrogenase family protein subunit M, partial [Burkholderiales bacterium]